MYAIQLPAGIAINPPSVASVLGVVCMASQRGELPADATFHVDGQQLWVQFDGSQTGPGDDPARILEICDFLKARFKEDFVPGGTADDLSALGSEDRPPAPGDVAELVPGPKTLPPILDPAQTYDRRRDEVEAYLTTCEAACGILKESIVHLRERL